MKKNKTTYNLKNHLLLIVCFICLVSCSKTISHSKIGKGWSNNSINTVKFRKNALTTFEDIQFTAYYDNDSFLVLGKRKLNSPSWISVKTPYKGNIKDAHNAISIAVDGDGFLHVSWDHHNTLLRYAISKTPLSLDLGEEIIMTVKQEDKVTYPEFYNLPNGNLIFFYRSGKSGRGNLVINAYDVKSRKWTQLHHNLIDGENKRNAYWQACVDNKGVIHISWVWRETWDVETNHDLCYARSLDGGKTWEKSTGEKYKLPITLASAEYAWKIPQNSNLINQTAMCTNKNGEPYIATYFNENEITQYQIVYLENGYWKKTNSAFRKTSFTLGGGGTKKTPISRPDILINDSKIVLLFRDQARNNKASLAYTDIKDIAIWNVLDLDEKPLGEWEPNYDISLWNKKRELNIFFQNVTQIDGEGIANNKPSDIKVLQIKNLSKLINE
ncbi:BNR repeat-containing protein [Thalassobellus sediminis]|uniref:BNR repeat-containing protein n=1 Tax=Thalassobellus sediminis TaxID=3367753 RepID=UPI0037AE6BE2